MSHWLVYEVKGLHRPVSDGTSSLCFVTLLTQDASLGVPKEPVFVLERRVFLGCYGIQSSSFG